MTDVNGSALELARANASANDVVCECVEGSGLEPVAEAPDVIIANPPFIADRGQTYQAGGGGRGEGVTLAWAKDGMSRLNAGGRMLLYAGAPVVSGRDVLREALLHEAHERSCTLDYEEIDPDIFGGELRRPAYADVDRIAAIGAVIRRGH